MKPAGFTLIELVVTVALVGLLAAMVVPTVEMTVKRAKEAELRLALRDLRRAIDAYKQGVDDGRVLGKVGESGYPPALSLLVEGVNDERSPDKRKIFFLRRMPRDPMSTDADAAPEETWGLRSYASDPDAPAEGADVYDVYSRSRGIGINGIAYARW